MEQLRDEPVDLEVVSTEVVYEGAVWDVRSDTVRYGDGEMTRQYVEHPGAAAVVAIDDDERVVLIQQYRHPIKERDWEIPAGLLDVAGEPPLETAKRELTEEVDLEADRWQHLLSMRTTPGATTRSCTSSSRAVCARSRPTTSASTRSPTCGWSASRSPR